MRLWNWMHVPKTAQDDQSYELYDVYSKLLDRNGQWIGVADAKAAVILVFLVAIFPVLAVPVLLITQISIRTIPHNARFWVYLPLVGSIILLTLFLITAFITFHHVLKTLKPRLTRQRKPSLIFFGDIANLEYGQWQECIVKLDPHMLALQVSEQVYATAEIAHYKHRHVQQAIFALLLALIFGLELSALSKFID